MKKMMVKKSPKTLLQVGINFFFFSFFPLSKSKHILTLMGNRMKQEWQNGNSAPLSSSSPVVRATRGSSLPGQSWILPSIPEKLIINLHSTVL